MVRFLKMGKILIVFGLTMSQLLPTATSQAADILHFSAKEILKVSESESPQFQKGDHMTNAEMKREATDFCGEYYSSSPRLQVQGVSGSLGNYKLKNSSWVLSSNWTIAPNGENLHVRIFACKQWGNFTIPTSEGYKFKLKSNTLWPRIPPSPWYSKKFLSQNQWNLNYFRSSPDTDTQEIVGEDKELSVSRWLPRVEFPAMPEIRLLSVDDTDSLFPLTTLEISGSQFTSIPKGGWDRWTIEFTDSFSLPVRMYTAKRVGNFTWALKVKSDEIPAPSFEIRITQSGYGYSSLIGKFKIPLVGENVQLSDVHRSFERAILEN